MADLSTQAVSPTDKNQTWPIRKHSPTSSAELAVNFPLTGMALSCGITVRHERAEYAREY